MELLNNKKEKTPKKLSKREDNIFVFVILFIPIVHWLFFYLYVNFDSILLAFKIPTGAWSLVSIESVVKEIFTSSSSSLQIAIKNTLAYFIKDVLMIAVQFILAYFLYRKIKGRSVFRMFLYLPGIIGGVIMVTVYGTMIAPDGPLYLILEQMGFQDIPMFLSDSRYATSAIMVYTIWTGLGGNLLILCGSLAKMPIEVLEAGRLDGISAGREMVSVILPLCWPTLSTLIILNLTGLFGAGGPILIFDEIFSTGSMDVETTTIGYWIFEKVYRQGSSAYNEVAAAGLVFTTIGVPVILTIRRLIERIPVVEF